MKNKKSNKILMTPYLKNTFKTSLLKLFFYTLFIKFRLAEILSAWQFHTSLFPNFNLIIFNRLRKHSLAGMTAVDSNLKSFSQREINVNPITEYYH